MILSIVAPVYNEEAVIAEFIDRALSAARASPVSEFELILVDDGSLDRSSEIINEKITNHPGVIKLIELSRNFGQQCAYHAGLSFARGDLVVTLDTDLQDPPELIPQLIEKIQDGFDLVYAKRVLESGGSWGASGHTGLKSLGAFLFHLLMSKRRRSPVVRDVGEYRCMRRKIVDYLMEFPERMIFIPGLVTYVGFNVGVVDYVRSQRKGRPQASVWSLITHALDAFTSFSVMPLDFIFKLTCAVWLLPLTLLSWIVVRLVRFGTVPNSATLAWLAALGAWCLTLTTVGIVAHYVGRMFLEVKRRPRYFVTRTVGIHSQETHGVPR